MKSHLLIFLWLALNGALFATDKVVTLLVTIPIYHKWEDADVRFVKIPHVGWDLNAFWHCELLSNRYLAGGSNLEQDINLISLYGLKVNYTYKDQASHIDIVTDQGRRPEDFKFSVKDVAELTAKAIRLDFPDASSSVIYIDGVKQSNGEQK